MTRIGIVFLGALLVPCQHLRSSPSIMTRHTFIHDKRTTISYEVHGAGTHNLIMLHGFGASAESWRDIEPLLSESNRLYLVDLKGFGLSSKPKDGAYSIEDQAKIVADFIATEDIRNVVLVGHSYGGGVALLAYLKLREYGEASRVSGLVLVDSAGYLQTFPFFVKVLRIKVLNRILLNCFSARFRAEHTLRRIFYDQRKVTRERIDRYARYFDLPGAHYAQIESARQIVPHDPQRIIQAIPTINVPTLVLWGANDPVIPLSSAYRFSSDLRNSQLVIIPECGHVTHEEQAAESAKHIARFLAGLSD